MKNDNKKLKMQLFLWKRSDKEIHGAYNNHSPECRGPAANDQFWNKAIQQKEHSNVYDDCKESKGEKYKRSRNKF